MKCTNRKVLSILCLALAFHPGKVMILENISGDRDLVNCRLVNFLN